MRRVEPDDKLPFTIHLEELRLRIIYCVFMFVIAFGLIFEMPLVIVFLTKMGMVTPDWFAKQRSYFIVGDFIVAAALTPTPDVVSQLMMAVPMMILFEVGLLASRLIAPKKTEQGDA